MHCSALGPVPLFEVTDLLAAASELRATGVDIVGSAGVDNNWRWIHFRAADGHLYEMGVPNGCEMTNR